MSNWWKQFPQTESRAWREMPPDASAKLLPGDHVRLAGKPERTRRVIRSEWHAHSYQIVYIVETSAPPPFEPYWFYDQLISN